MPNPGTTHQDERTPSAEPDLPTERRARLALVGFPPGWESALLAAFGESAKTFRARIQYASHRKTFPGEIELACVMADTAAPYASGPVDGPFIAISESDYSLSAARSWIERGALAFYSASRYELKEIAALAASHASGLRNANAPSGSQSALIELDEQLRIAAWPPEAESLFGHPARDALGLPIGEWLLPSFEALLLLRAMAVLAESTPGGFHAQCQAGRYDGSYLRANWKFSAASGNAETPRSIACLCQAIAEASEFPPMGKADSLFRQAQIGEETASGIWYHSLSDKRLYWSPNIHHRFPPASLKAGPSLLRYLGKVHPDDRHRLRDVYTSCMNGRTETFALVYRMRSKDESWRYFHVRGIRSTDPFHHGPCIACSDQDITHYIETAEEFKFAKLTVDHSSAGVVWIDRRGKIIYHNQAVVGILGYSSAELLRMPATQIDPDWERFPREAAADPSARRIIEKTYKVKDGQSIDVEIDRKYVDANDETVLVVYLRDISRRKQAERQALTLNRRLEERVIQRTSELADANQMLMREMEERRGAEDRASRHRASLANILEKLPIGVYVKEADKDFAIGIWNAEMERLFNTPKEQIIGRRIHDVFADPLLVESIGTIERKSFKNRSIAPRRKGNRIGIESFVADITKALIYDKDGKTTALVGIVQNVTERVLNESRLIAAFKDLEDSKAQLEFSNLEIRRGIEKAKKLAIDAQASNRAKSFFMSNISHELRTPLNSIVGMTHILIEENFGALNDKQREYLGIVDDSSRHLLSLITDILDLSKIELGKLRLNVAHTNPGEIAEACLRMIQQQAENKKVACELICHDPALDLEVDPRRLRQILLNLLGNAVKFSEDNRRVTLTIDAEGDPDRVIFSVADQGIGIQPEDMQLLFKPFSQLDDSLSRQYEGTGLGLVIAARFVELHGGSLNVRSYPGRGSVFSFSLPTATAKPAPAFETLATPPTSCDALIIDDNGRSAAIHAAAARACGFSSPLHITPSDLAARFAQFTPRLIIVDTGALAHAGADWIEAARQSPSWKDTIWVANSWLNMPADRDDARALGFNRFLPKPITSRALATILDPQIR